MNREFWGGLECRRFGSTLALYLVSIIFVGMLTGGVWLLGGRAIALRSVPLIAAALVIGQHLLSRRKRSAPLSQFDSILAILRPFLPTRTMSEDAGDAREMINYLIEASAPARVVYAKLLSSVLWILYGAVWEVLIPTKRKPLTTQIDPVTAILQVMDSGDFFEEAELFKHVEERTEGKVLLDQEGFYSTLQALKRNGLIEGQLSSDQGERSRTYYRLTEQGCQAALEERQVLLSLVAISRVGANRFAGPGSPPLPE